MNKHQARDLLYKKLNSISLDQRNQASASATDYLLKKFSSLPLVGSFFPLENEIQITPFNQKLCKEGRLALPRMEGPHLVFYKVKSLENLIKSRFNTLEPDPKSSKEVAPRELSIVIVPGLAYHQSGCRLGRGSGFYDRFLFENPDIQSIGVCYKLQILEDRASFPLESHDQKVNGVLSF